MPASPIRPAPRCSWRSSREPRSDLRVVQVDQARAARARSGGRTSSTKASIAAASERSWPAPQAWAVSRQNATRPRCDAGGVKGVRDGAELGDVDPEPEAAAGRVLERDRRRRTAVRDRPAPAPRPRLRRRAARRARRSASSARRIAVATRSMPRPTPSPPCDPMWTFTSAAPKRRAVRSSVASIATDRSWYAGSLPARLTRYEAWIASGRDLRPTRAAPGTRGSPAMARRGAARPSGCR